MEKLEKKSGQVIEFFGTTKKLSGYFKDDVSKNLYRNILLYHSTNDEQALANIFDFTSQKTIDAMKVIDQLIEEIAQSNVRIVIYGVGLIAQNTFEKLNRSKDVFFTADVPKMDCFRGVPFITPQELVEDYKDAKILVASYSGQNKICEFLTRSDVSKENIVPVGFCDFDDMYFDEIINFGKDEIFVDAGVFDADTSIRFANKCTDYKKIYLFEPDEVAYDVSKTSLELRNIKNTQLTPVGLWHKEDTLHFNNSFSGSHIDDTSETIIKVNTIDNLLKDIPVTFIKMDIEGAELNALYGARETILKYKPKLAISVYHKPEDIVQIPEYITSLVPEYKLYLRHYSNCQYETVLYATL